MRTMLFAGVLLLPASAFAGGSAVPGGSATSTSASNAISGSRSRADQKVTNKIKVTNTIQPSASGPGGRGNDRAPDIMIGSIGSSDPCGVGGGLGGSGPGAGGFFQWLFESDRCSLRADVRLMANDLHDPGAAKEAACNNPWIADGYARRTPPEPCEKDRQRWMAAGYHERPDGYWVKP